MGSVLYQFHNIVLLSCVVWQDRTFYNKLVTLHNFLPGMQHLDFLPFISQLYTYRQIDENVKKCWRNERNDKCIDGVSQTIPPIIFLILRFAVLARQSVFLRNVREEIGKSRQVSRRIKDERNRRYCEKCVVIGSQSHEIVHEHVETRETISV